MIENKRWTLAAAFATVLLAALMLGGCAPPTPTPTPAVEVSFAHPELLVETDWLAEHLDDPNIRIVDVRAAEKYQKGHIRNAVNLVVSDPEGPFYDQDHPVKWMILPQERFEDLMGDLGISNDTTVVAYDDARGLWASRLFWALEYYGHKRARVLNGGLKKWEAEGRELSQEVPEIAKATYSAEPDPSKYATKELILDRLGKEDTIIVATISEAEYTGEKKYSKRGGHIPGAIRIDWVENLTKGDVPVFRSAAELTKLYEEAGVTKDKEVILY